MADRKIRLGVWQTDPVVDFTVQELTRCLQLMDPVLSIEVFRAETLRGGLLPIVWVGMHESFSPFLPPVTDPAMDDSIAIQIQNNSGFITGTNARSVLIAAYRFLKELGCDWVRPGKEGERIPRRDISSVSVSIQEAAACRHRGVCIEGAVSYENIADMLDFLPKIGMNAYFFQHFEPVIFFRRWYHHKSNPYLEAQPIDRDDVLAMLKKLEGEMARRGILYHKGGHGWNNEPFGLDGTSWKVMEEQLVPDDTRKYLAQIDGKRGLWKGTPMLTNLCYSNRDARKRMIDAAVQYCIDHPQIDILHFWLADGVNNHCECPDCARMLPSDWYMLLLNELDEALTEALLDVRIVFLLYVDLLWAPETCRLKNPDRFILMFAPVTRSYGQNYGDLPDYAEEIPPYRRNRLNFSSSLSMNLAQMRQWRHFFTGDSFLYDYHLMYAHFNDPGYETCARNVFEDMKCLPRIGLNGMLSCQLQRCFFPTALPMQMMAAALWNGNCDYDEKANAYYLSAFGQDGLQARQYLQKLSGLFNLYAGPSHGKGAVIQGKLCRDNDTLAQLIHDFLPVIENHCRKEDVYAADWQILLLHSRYVLSLAEALAKTEAQDEQGAREAIEATLDEINRHEEQLQPVMDGNKIKMHWGRRLDPIKCRGVDVL